MKKKVLRYLITAVVFAIVGPLIIHFLYQFENPIIITDWDAVDLLEYYGTILSAVISVLVIWITIANEHEKIADERRNQNKKIEAQRHYDNLNEIVDIAANSITVALKELDPRQLYYLYYDHLLDFQNDIRWLIEMRKDSSTYLSRVHWLVTDCLGRIGEVECYEIHDSELREIRYNLHRIYIDYMEIDNLIADIGRVMIEASEYNNTAFFEVIDKLLTESSVKSMYDDTCSQYGKVVQDLRGKIVKKFNTELCS